MPTSDKRGLGKGTGTHPDPFAVGAEEGFAANRTARSRANPSSWPEHRVCPTCLNAGWLTEESKSLGKSGRLIRCPTCQGESAAERNSEAAVKTMIARVHLKTERIRAAEGLPPAGTAAVTGERDKPEAPPEGFSKADGQVPLLGGEEARERMRRQIAANVRAVATKLTGPAR